MFFCRSPQLSATDPVAVVALLRELGASRRLGTLIEGNVHPMPSKNSSHTDAILKHASPL